jgi:hypothetical protein
MLPVPRPDKHIFAVALFSQSPIFLFGIESHLRPLPRYVPYRAMIAKPYPKVRVKSQLKVWIQPAHFVVYGPTPEHGHAGNVIVGV